MNQVNPEAPGQGEAPGTYVKKLTYGLDAANNRTSIAAQAGSGGATTTETYTTDDDSTPSNRYIVAEGVSVLYDERGNTTFDGNYYYVYDEQDRLSEVYILANVDGAANSPDTLATDPSTGSTAAVANQGRFLVNNASALRAARSAILAQAAGSLADFVRRHDERPYANQFKLTLSPLVAQPEPGSQVAASAASSSFSFTEMQLVATYQYDYSNRRVVRMVMGAGETHFTAWDGWQEAVELDLDGTGTQALPKKQLVWGEQLDELVALRVKGATQWADYFVAEGGAHCPQRLLNASGAVAEVQEYDPYGKTTFFSGTTSGDASLVGNPFGWKAVRIDPETGLLYMRNRYYSTKWGRLLTNDPLGIWGDALSRGSGLSYAVCNPMTLGDPFGLQTIRVGNLDVAPGDFDGRSDQEVDELLSQNNQEKYNAVSDKMTRDKRKDFVASATNKQLEGMASMVSGIDPSDPISIVCAGGGMIAGRLVKLGKLGRGLSALSKYEKATLDRTIQRAAQSLKRLEKAKDDAAKLAAKGGRSVDAALDATGKVHGKLPAVEDLGKYGKDELVKLRDELELSVKKRIEVTAKKGSDFGHSERQAQEQQLIKSIEKHLRDRR